MKFVYFSKLYDATFDHNKGIETNRSSNHKYSQTNLFKYCDQIEGKYFKYSNNYRMKKFRRMWEKREKLFQNREKLI